jgi:hypothetical protein
MNFRGNKLQDIRFNFKKLKYLFDNETAQVIIKTKNGKIEADTEAHSFNDSLEIKEGKKIEEIVVAKDIEQIPIFGFPNNSN